MMHGREKSDPAIVATKPPNEARTGAEAAGEPRAGAKGKADQQSTRRAQDRESVSQALDRLRQAARLRVPVERKAEEEGTVHRAPPPHQPRPAPDGLPRPQATSRPRRGWADVAGLRNGPRSPDRE